MRLPVRRPNIWWLSNRLNRHDQYEVALQFYRSPPAGWAVIAIRLGCQKTTTKSLVIRRYVQCSIAQCRLASNLICRFQQARLHVNGDLNPRKTGGEADF